MDPNTFNSKQILEDHLTASIEKDIKPLVYSLKVDEDAGYFSAMLLILANIDFLGVLYSGVYPNVSSNAVKYMRKYMGQVDSDYKRASGAIYHIWRHGTVHQRLPKKIKMNSRVTTSWALDKMAWGKGLGASKGTLIIAIPKFYQDFKRSIELFLQDVQHSKYREKRLLSGWKKILEVEDWLIIKNGRGKSYLRISDYKFLCKRKV